MVTSDILNKCYFITFYKNYNTFKININDFKKILGNT